MVMIMIRRRKGYEVNLTTICITTEYAECSCRSSTKLLIYEQVWLGRPCIAI